MKVWELNIERPGKKAPFNMLHIVYPSMVDTAFKESDDERCMCLHIASNVVYLIHWCA